MNLYVEDKNHDSKSCEMYFIFFLSVFYVLPCIDQMYKILRGTNTCTWIYECNKVTLTGERSVKIEDCGTKS